MYIQVKDKWMKLIVISRIRHCQIKWIKSTFLIFMDLNLNLTQIILKSRFVFNLLHLTAYF